MILGLFEVLKLGWLMSRVWKCWVNLGRVVLKLFYVEVFGLLLCSIISGSFLLVGVGFFVL